MGSASSTSAAAGLPFAGVPEELREKAEELLATEPEHPELHVEFHAIDPDTRSFTLRTFLGPRKWAVALAALLVVVETVSLQLGPLLTGIAIDDGVRARDFGVVVGVFVAYLVAIGVNGLSGFTRIRFSGRLAEDLIYDLRIRVFSHLQRLSLSFFTDEKAGRLMTRMTSDIEALTLLFQDVLVQLAVQGLTLVTVAVILFILDPVLAAITLLLVVPVMSVATLWFRSASDKSYGAVRDRIALVLADLQESLAGIRVISAHNRRHHNIVNHRNVVGHYFDANDRVARIGAIYGPGTEAVGVIAQAVLILIGGRMVLRDELEVGELVSFVLFLTAFFAPIQQLVNLYNQYQAGQAAMAKLRDLFDTDPEVPDAPDAVELPLLDGQIEFRYVSFGYDPGELVLADVDLRIEAGETFALVGPTGAGKSTVAKLVSRFYDPTSGEVLLDGHDLRSVTQRSLRRQLGVVPQEPFLFHGTIRDNVAFSDPDATDEVVLGACRAVGIDDLVDRLPLGLDTPTHERGSSLSSGERQLLALARAFLSRPRVLILDEATSNLDLLSEQRIEQALDVLLEGRTAIVIAHRLATAMRADRIAVIDDGGVVELGSHDELVAQGGRYAEMFATWQEHLR
ncbi:MAG: ABC transporter ATP-binding protein [Actinomycetia bacterium]|nr:ABC transporter ATP-binding protein [Actinomycetes bacterium]